MSLTVVQVVEGGIKVPVTISTSADLPIQGENIAVPPVGVLVGDRLTEQLAEIADLVVPDLARLKTSAGIHEEFFGSRTSTLAAPEQIGQYGWTTNLQGTGAQVIALASVFPNSLLGLGSAAGVYRLDVGTTTTGRANVNIGLNSAEGSPAFIGEWRANVVQLRTVAQEFSFYVGFFTPNTGAPTKGFFFRHSSASANWQACCADTTVTAVDTGVVVAPLVWHRFRVICDGVGMVTFYIDDVIVAQINTDLPDVGEGWCPQATIQKSAGTTTVSADVDYCDFDLAVSR